MITYSENDVGREFARRAFYGTSHFPEQRGDRTITDYLAHMEAVAREFEPWATDDNRAELAAELEAYRAKYANLLRAYLGSHTGVVSAFIAGPANFPTRRMEKRSQWADNHRARWLKFSDERLDQLRRKYDPRRLANAPVSSDDADAVGKLQAKVEQAERLQEAMKAANRIVRGKSPDDQKVAGMVALGLSEKSAHAALVPDYMGKVGFPDYALKNNGANIRRMKGRVADLERARQDETTETEADNGVRIVDSVEDNRVQIFFPGKPAAAVRDQLKGRGFRWAPSIGAWQRQRNDAALYWAQQIVASEGEG